MKQSNKELTFKTNKNKELIKITSEVEDFISETDIKNGLCVIFALHATGAIIINEDEEGLKEDFLNNIEKILPQNGFYKHNIYDNNAVSHIASSLFGQGKNLIIKNRRLQRGTWQDIFFLELDGPRGERKVLIEIIGE